MMNSGPHPPEIDQLAAKVWKRNLATSALLGLTSHRPLGFLAGQGMHLLMPIVSSILTKRALRTWIAWADLLSSPDGMHHLETLLTNIQTESTTEQTKNRENKK